MNTQFNDIIHRLKTNQKLCIEIKDHTNGDPILPVTDRIDGNAMIEKYGSIEQYFIDLQNKGINKIQIQLHKKQGNACVRDGIAYDFQLGTSEEKKEVSPSHDSYNHLDKPKGLNGSSMGLSMPDMIDLHVDRNMLGVTKQELAQEKQKIERLEKENKDLEEKVRRFERSQDSKEFWGGLIKEAAPALAGIFTTMKAPGLAAPESNQETPDGLRGQLIKVLYQSEDLTDDQITAAFYVLKGYSNKTFVGDLQQLFITHKFIENGQNNTDQE